MPSIATLTTLDFRRLIETVRLELQEAGNPAFIVAVLDAAGAAHLLPMVFSAVGPAGDHARRVATDLEPDEALVVVSRQAARDRQTYEVLDARTLRRLHVQPEVIEPSYAETRGAI